MPEDIKKVNYTSIDGSAGLDEKGLKSQFIDTFCATAEAVEQKIGKVASIVTTDRLFERFDYALSTPNPKRFNGETKYHHMEWAGIKIEIAEFKDGIEWSHKDELNILSGKTLLDKAMTHGRNYAKIPWYMIEKVLLATTDTDYLPTAITGYDGYALIYPTSADSTYRFGRENGNFYTGTGVTAESTVEADIIGAICTFPSFLDEKTNRPLFEEAVDRQKYYVLYSPALAPIMQRTMKRYIQTVSTNATQSSILQMGGFDVELIMCGGLTGNTYFVVIDDPIKKPFIILHGDYKVPKVFTYGLDGSHKEMDDKMMKAVSFYDAFGIGILNPASIIEVYNA